jgi:hypothetical protein
MSGFTGHRTPEAERPEEGGAVFTWGAAQAMLPLVARIADDLVRLCGRLDVLRPELAGLERSRHTLAWPERQRRYALHEEEASTGKELRAVQAELTDLGVVVLHGPSGLVGFPTIVNEQPAFFSWRPGEEGLTFWNFAGDPARRPVPEAWTQPPPEKRPGKGRPRSRR